MEDLLLEVRGNPKEIVEKVKILNLCQKKLMEFGRLLKIKNLEKGTNRMEIIEPNPTCSFLQLQKMLRRNL